MEQEKNNKPKKAKKTVEEIKKDLEENGLDLSPAGLGPWSHSKLKVLRNCPLKFYLQYILKAQPQGEVEISLVTEIGKAAHKIIELMLGGKKLEDAYILTRKEYSKVLTPEEWKENLENIEYNLISFKERVEKINSEYGVKRIFQEIKIGVTNSWEPTGFFSEDVYYRGVIDLAIQLMNGDLIIVDHKYGTSSAMGLRNFNDQLQTYKVLFHKGIDPIKGAQAGIHHIKEGEIILDDYHDAEEIEGNLLNRIEFSIQGAIDALKEIGYFKHIAGNTCKYCDYRTACKAGEYKTLEKESKKWFEIKKI